MSHTSVMLFALRALLAVALGVACPSLAEAQSKSQDADNLGMALEYFQASKYHEALLIFQRLDKRYKLNPRFRAYIGLCYYYEWEYKKAVEYFDKVLPELKGLSPHELSVYYYAAAESYFQMQKYDKALPYFTLDLQVCYNREKGDVYYRIGLCHMFHKEWHKAYNSYTLAEEYYHEYRDTTDLGARLAQIANMKRGCTPGMREETDEERGQMLHETYSDAKPLESPWNDISVPFISYP